VVLWQLWRFITPGLHPKEKKYVIANFGFFNLANRVASAFAPLVIWSGSIWLLHEKTEWLGELGASRVAVGGLALTAIAGWLVLRRLSDAQHDACVELQVRRMP